MGALLPTLYFGFPIVAYRGRFLPEAAHRLIDRWRVTNTFLFPSALKQMMRSPARAGSMGRPHPGHRVALIDEQRRELPVGSMGEVALSRCDIHGHPDPLLFLGDWKPPTAGERKFSGDGYRTGDLARCDADGHLWLEGCADDVFKSSGYRIGPAEIEQAPASQA